MTRISFYVLNSQAALQRHHFACRLAEKAYLQGHRVMIYTEDEAQSAELDEALWAFRPDSFVPHELLSPETTPRSPVIISHHDVAPPNLMDVLINLNPVQPRFFSQFERLAEIIDDNDPIKQAGRQRYQFYKDRGYLLETHQI